MLARLNTSARCANGSEGLLCKRGAERPDALAYSLTLILDGGLANGALDASPRAPAAATRAARAVVDRFCPVAKQRSQPTK
jgi:hypothetical protein